MRIFAKSVDVTLIPADKLKHVRHDYKFDICLFRLLSVHSASLKEPTLKKRESIIEVKETTAHFVNSDIMLMSFFAPR